METQTIAPSVERAHAPERHRLVLILPGLLLGMLLAALDQTIVGTAMPRVIAELRGLEHYAWVFTAYMLTSTVTVPLYGKLSDIYGRRTFFLFGMVVFLLGSALSGMSQSMTQLILFRALQGLGGGALFPIAIAIVGDLFPPAERGKWQGLFAAVFGFSAIIGPSLGGWITDHWGWRWVFYVNMPIGLLALLTTGLTMPKLASGRQHRIDYLGAALLVAGVTPMLLAFSWAGTEYPWRSVRIIGLFVVSVLFLVLFTVAELRATEPILDLRLFKNRIFTPTLLAAFLIAIGMFGTILYLPLFVQAVLGRTATNSGAVLTPMMLAFVFSSVVGGQILSRTGRYKVLAIATVAVATLGMFLLSRMDVRTTNATVVRNMIVLGLGIGTTMSLFTIVMQNAFPPERLGEVTSALTFFRSIGGTVGAAILGTVMTNRFQSELGGRIPNEIRALVPPERLAALENPQVFMSPEAMQQMRQQAAAFGPQGQQLLDLVLSAVRMALATALDHVFLTGTIILAFALLCTMLIPEVPLRRSNARPPAALSH
ncbi:MDR family MFS transporter [Thermomicrobium sp. 4228-Ro]|uniref:MDR family MFS transporter n=1 Tax=Thermomicrobium sp. 4228-Ro TaxID=2993937 RepID=UPI0022490993|nr:MDR family MFS transporter [Thermomicrobium sp. 4228-Ro]MCX2727559.1 MDR family MFS transporter [Thermomicrobium sp. 4228-Ro]